MKTGEENLYPNERESGLKEKKLFIAESLINSDSLPYPGLFSSPETPSDLKRVTQLLTLTWLMPVIIPTAFELRPPAFNRMTWQRLQKQWLSPDLKPASRAERSEAVSSGVLTRPMPIKTRNNIN